MKYRLTTSGWLWIVLVAAAALRLYTWAVPPAIAVRNTFDRYYNIEENYGELSPFWPRYWRRLRGLPEPVEYEEILRSDDGGIVLIGSGTLLLAAAFTYAMRKRFLRRI